MFGSYKTQVTDICNSTSTTQTEVKRCTEATNNSYEAHVKQQHTSEDTATTINTTNSFFTYRKCMQYNFKTYRCNFKCARKQFPFIKRASEDGPVGPKHVRRLYWLTISVKLCYT
jgi:hypothetical protein